MAFTATQWIQFLNLQRHPEGGWFLEVHRSDQTVESPPHGAKRSAGTSIYYLLETNDFSAFHRLKSDETWHFYAGSSLELFSIQKDGTLARIILGPDPLAGHRFQWTFPAGTWFSARVQKPQAYALLGCTVAPGFDFGDFEIADRDELLRDFKQHEEIIVSMTRKNP